MGKSFENVIVHTDLLFIDSIEWRLRNRVVTLPALLKKRINPKLDPVSHHVYDVLLNKIYAN